MKWWRLGVMLGLLMLIWCVLQYPDGKLHVIFCDVGQGDATLIVKGDFQLLIDGGPRGNDTLSCLSHHMPFWDRSVEVVVNTHAEQDHLGGLPEVLGRFKVSQLIINGVMGQTKAAAAIKQLIREKKVKVKIPQSSDSIRYANLHFDVLWPEEKQGEALAWTGQQTYGKVLGMASGLNKESVVLMLRYGDFKAMFTGDIEENQELALEERGMLTGVDILKVAHHGSKTSSTEGFLKEVKPREAVISVGKNNHFGHPSKEVLDRLDALRSRVWRTDQRGEIQVVTNGTGYKIEGLKTN